METSEFERLTAWKEGYTRTIIVFVLITAVQIGLLVGAFQLHLLADIKKNFGNYRCNPLFMPFVGNFGYNPIDNFNFCVQSIFQGKAAEVFAPIYSILGTFQGVLMTIVNSALSIRGMFSNFLGGVENFIASVRNKIQFLMNNVRMSFIRILNLMGKVYGSMFAVLFMGQSAMTAAFNLGNNDLVKFLFEFCFAPDTVVKMADGTHKTIKDVVIGDVLAEVPNNKSPVVTSVFRFAGGSTPMVRIGDVVVSGAHYVLAGSDGMVPAEAHPDAVWAGSVPELVCLNVSGHRFRVGKDGLLVADYDEHDTAAVVGETQRMATKALNGRVDGEEPVMDYSLGVAGSSEVLMADGEWKRMDSIAIGDVVKHSGKVLGVVCEQCDTTVISPSGIVFSAAQIVYDSSANQWKRSANYWSRGPAGGAKTLYTIFTMNSGAISIRKGKSVEFIRDYREAPLPEMESAYEKEFLVAH
uniref:Vint domain-containing protein n=1 Tax=viral metagenome TaxID=1070528 RepID=A0A6C0LNE7_9ZZZZ